MSGPTSISTTSCWPSLKGRPSNPSGKPPASVAALNTPLIMGIDPGSRITGYGVVSKRGRQFKRVAGGRIRLPQKSSPEARLGKLLVELEKLLEREAPQQIAVEDVFSHRNPRSALMLGQARGVVLAAAGRRGLVVTAYAPAAIKKAVSGHGWAAKEQIQRMVQVLLGLEQIPPEDEADALAVAICHGMMSKQKRVLANAKEGRRST